MVDKQIGQNPRPPLTSDVRPLTSDPTALCSPDNQEQITDNWSKAGGFTLVELMVVIGIIAILMVLVVPAFTTLKSSGDITSAAYTIKGVLDQGRTYAKTNNTFTWVGFFAEDISSVTPGTAGTGRLVMSIVASTDGTDLGANASSSATGTNNFIDPTRLTQIGKLVKIDNIHLPLFAIGLGTGDTFNKRPPLQNDPVVAYNASRFGEINSTGPNTAPYDTTNNGLTKFPFQYPNGNPYVFRRTLRFGPTGESRINSTYDVRPVIEIGLVTTHGSVVPTPTAGAGTSTATYSGNVIAVQISGFGSNVKIYKR